MIFSTKSEYGVRVMVELARRGGAEPVALAEIAEHEGLPLAYLEHLVARLRRADLVTSRRGAHGGYRLGRAPAAPPLAPGGPVPISSPAAAARTAATGWRATRPRSRWPRSSRRSRAESPRSSATRP